MKLKSVLCLIGLVFLLLLFCAPTSFALNVPIENYNFELSNGTYNSLPHMGTWYDGDITAWENTGNGLGGIENHGIWAPNSKWLSTTSENEGYVGYLRNGKLTQELNHVVNQNVLYTVGIDIGNRSDKDFPDYSIALFAGSEELVRWENLITPEDGFFDSLVLSYAVTDNDFLNYGGDYLTLEIASSGQQLNFDNVWMTNDRVGSAAPVPEPTTLILVGSGMAGLAIFRRKRSIKA